MLARYLPPAAPTLRSAPPVPDIFAPLVNNPAETQFIADVAADLGGEGHVDRNRSLIMGSEDFARMLEARPGAYIFIGNGDTVSSRPFSTTRITISTTLHCLLEQVSSRD
jgi:metal-dependent amidase/aminoacylase/carboxypeptidase family protein